MISFNNPFQRLLTFLVWAAIVLALVLSACTLFLIARLVFTLQFP